MSAPALLDARGRPLRDLRISVTDRCNFRCRYCMPREHFQSWRFLPRSRILTFEEITRLASLFVDLGVQKIRITGGEPLLRRDLPLLIERLARLGVDLALTTNGVLLPLHAAALRAAGLRRITLSLDALEEDVFQRVCDAPGYSVGDVLEGLAAAERAGFTPVKINCVIRRGQNENQIEPLVRRMWKSGHVLRFIEYMDVGAVNGWARDEVASRDDLLQILARWAPVTALPKTTPGEVAHRYQLGDGLEFGIVPSISTPFCGQCSRARLSADGSLHTCLFSSAGEDLMSTLRSGAGDAALSDLIRGVWQRRRDRYSEERSAGLRAASSAEVHGAAPYRLPLVGRVEMSYIGG